MAKPQIITLNKYHKIL